MKIRLALVLLLLSSAPHRVIAQRATEDSMAALEQARAQALLHADTAALGKLLAPEFVEISRLGALRTRADNIRDISSGDLKLLSIKYDSTMVRVYGDVALLTAISLNAGQFHGMPFAGKIRYTRVFVRRNGVWQAVLVQQTPIQ